MNHPPLIKAAIITGAHGIRGQVKLRWLLASPPKKTATLSDANGTPVTLTLSSNGGVGAIDGVTDRNAAEALRGKELFQPAAALPKLKKNEFYYSQLQGLEVRNASGTALGKIHAAHDFGAGHVVEIEFADGKREMFPFNQATFPEVKVEAGFVTFDAPEEI